MGDWKDKLLIANSSLAISLAIWGLVGLFVLALVLALIGSFSGDSNTSGFE